MAKLKREMIRIHPNVVAELVQRGDWAIVKPDISLDEHGVIWVPLCGVRCEFEPGAGWSIPGHFVPDRSLSSVLQVVGTIARPVEIRRWISFGMLETSREHTRAANQTLA